MTAPHMVENLMYVQAQLVRSRGSGLVHERYRIKGRWVQDERCNLDQAQLVALGDVQVSEVDASALCGHCFSDATPPRA